MVLALLLLLAAQEGRARESSAPEDEESGVLGMPGATVLPEGSGGVANVDRKSVV